MVVLKWLLPLAPALLSAVLAFYVEIWPLVRAARNALFRKKEFLELSAEVSVHLSTYGTLIVAWVLHAFHISAGNGLKTMLGLVWFVAFLRLSYFARVAIADEQA